MAGAERQTPSET